jgi:hypothetical protein
MQRAHSNVHEQALTVRRCACARSRHRAPANHTTPRSAHDKTHAHNQAIDTRARVRRRRRVAAIGDQRARDAASQPADDDAPACGHVAQPTKCNVTHTHTVVKACTRTVADRNAAAIAASPASLSLSPLLAQVVNSYASTHTPTTHRLRRVFAALLLPFVAPSLTVSNTNARIASCHVTASRRFVAS